MQNMQQMGDERASGQQWGTESIADQPARPRQQQAQAGASTQAGAQQDLATGTTARPITDWAAI